MIKTKILLVEDDKSLREIYGVRLYSEGYDIISAGDGEEALALAIKERPSLIISDVMMPKISGFDMLDILRSTTETKNIKVIMMTALSSEDQRARGEALGADRYLVKSQVGIEDVVRTVHEVLADAPVSGSTPAPTAPAVAEVPAAPGAPTAVPPAPVADAAPVAPPVPAETAAPTPATLPTPGVPPTPVSSFQPSPLAAPSVPADTNEAGLPQPTAPFSTDRPQTLGDRVIHPITSSEPDKDFSAMMSEELSTAPAGPATTPVGGSTLPPDEPVAPLVPPVPPAEPTLETPVELPASEPVSSPKMPAAEPASTLPPEPEAPAEPSAPVEPPAVPAASPTDLLAPPPVPPAPSSGLNFEETPAPATPPSSGV